MTRRAQIVGVGLIGGSIGLALRAEGWHVTGTDRSAEGLAQAVDLGAVDVAGVDPDAELTFVATPVGAIADAVAAALRDTRGAVTDVGSVKAPMTSTMREARYVGGHPMAGSELEGVAGARADLFEGRTWVLTPVASTDTAAYMLVRSTVAGFGAEVVSLDPSQHDRIVAVVSHVPHLTAATLMRLADARSAEHRSLLRLAAGGFRDMTRIAAGHPGIWPDICSENREAIVGTLDDLIDALGAVRDVVAAGDRAALLGQLEEARRARQNLPLRFALPDELAELRIPIPDRPGELARITTLAASLDVSIFDIEISHSAEGDEGVLILTIEAAHAARLSGELASLGYHPTSRELGP